MTAGRGIVHSEMPTGADGTVTRGLQLWVNLAKEHKMCEPQYQEHLAKDRPKAEKDGVKVKGEDTISKLNKRNSRAFLMNFSDHFLYVR